MADERVAADPSVICGAITPLITRSRPSAVFSSTQSSA